jgi:ubiquitin-protein ligase
VFAAELKFPKDYPLSPPTMKFVGGGVWHPNGMSSGPRPRHSSSLRWNSSHQAWTDTICSAI